MNVLPSKLIEQQFGNHCCIINQKVSLHVYNIIVDIIALCVSCFMQLGVSHNNGNNDFYTVRLLTRLASGRLVCDNGSVLIEIDKLCTHYTT